MQKRSMKHTHKKRSTYGKVILASILFLTITLASFSVLAADGNISSILTDWFSKKETEAITEIDDTITKAQKEQTERLKATLKEKMNKQEEELDQFLDTEKEKRTDALETYADELIKEFETDDSNDKEIRVSEMEAIMEEAKEQMDAVAKTDQDEAVNEEEQNNDTDSDDENQKEDSNEDKIEEEEAE